MRIVISWFVEPDNYGEKILLLAAKNGRVDAVIYILEELGKTSNTAGRDKRQEPDRADSTASRC